MINKWIIKRSRDMAGNLEIHRNQGDITEKRNEQKMRSTWNSQNKKVQDLVLSCQSIFQ